MLSYLQITFRNIRRQKGYTVVNIVGLAVGIAACILMLLYVRDEFTFDAFHSKSDRIYRLVETGKSAERGVRQFPYSMGPLGAALVKDYPEVVQSVLMRDASGMGRFTVGYKDRLFYEGDYLAAGPSFFQVFDFSFLQGDPHTALSEPNSVVLTEATARKYFGDENPIGKTMKIERYFGESKVTGLISNPPANSHLQFSMVFSLVSVESNPNWKRYIESWDSDGFLTYIVATEGTEDQTINARIASQLDSHRAALDKEIESVTAQPLRDIHFGSANIEFDRNSGKTEITSVMAFSAIAILVLLIASINYINLATGRAMKRAKEIGMRKVAGAQHWQLLLQLLAESILFAGLSLVVAIVLVEFLLPGFNSLAGKSLELRPLAEPLVLGGLLALTIIVGLLSGAYPALYLARLNPMSILKTHARSGSSSGGALRRTLVVVQFVLTIVMIVATAVAYRQLEYIHSKNLGFDKDRLVVVDINSGATRRSFEAIKSQMAQLPEVKNVSVSSRVPGEWKNISEIGVIPSGAAPDESHAMNFICIDADFLETFQMQLIAGRNFSGSSQADTASVILNEAAARILGWDDPLGREIVVPARNYRARVIGIVKDFNFRSLHESVGPLVLGHWNNPVTAIDYFTVRFQTADVTGLVKSLEKIHGTFDTVTPMEYNFLGDRIEDFYRNDERVGEIFTIAAVLAIVIACLGLLGLVSFVTEQRTKEIGVRKVLGASVPNILLLLTKEFILLVAIATVIAAPIAYTALQSWLQGFAFRIDMNWWTFIAAGLFALLLALLTVSVQTVRAASANPVDALRYE